MNYGYDNAMGYFSRYLVLNYVRQINNHNLGCLWKLLVIKNR
ncbi:MAG: hypothetical protein ACD_9C00311G0001 [uncultured bacterium]|nr:MAG: hypothetical protein ACD_9C00311G0001 [uncultured bacterium]